MTDEQIDAVTDAQWGKGCQPNQYMAHRAYARAILKASTEPQAVDGELPPLPEPLEIVWPQLHHQGLGCGVEDRNITDRYEAAEYGWQTGVDAAAECVPDELFTAEQVYEVVRADRAARSGNEARLRLAVEALEVNHDGTRVPASSFSEAMRRIDAALSALREGSASPCDGAPK